MNDYVSKQAVIDYLMKNMNWYDEDDRMVDDWSEKEPIITELIKGVPTGWISVKERLPEDDKPVIAVKELKNKTRDICIARCLLEWEHFDIKTGETVKSPYWVCGGNNNIIYWMPMPELPEEDEPNDT